MKATPLPADIDRSLLAELARPSPAYKRRTWAALAALVLFLGLYLTLATWFGLTAYRLTIGGGTADDALWGWIGGLCAAFLAVFMFKALFFFQRGRTGDPIELLPAEQPELFDFLHRLADQAGAPRPHKVFVSAEVNAAVFYDLSLLNLIVPSRKNLVIGLGLVQALSLGELRAVLAHEFGHFAQRAMAVGRWVYIAQQIAGHMVARRDKLDDLLRALSRTDPRIAWVGWVLSLIVWSIRSLVDTAYRAVALGQRALSREMEMNADLVAVALTGSDALIHALHRLQAADDAWGRALRFVLNEKAQGRRVSDLFAVQQAFVDNMGALLNDPLHGRVAPLPAQAAQHRVFKPALAQPPRMWLTHPLNHEREANAKRRYISAPIDDSSAWQLFRQPQALRDKVTAQVLGPNEAAAQPLDATLKAVDNQFQREHLKSRYRGTYFARSPVRHSTQPEALWESRAAPTPEALAALYPASLADDIERLRTLEDEEAQLRALADGHLQAAGGVIRFRDRSLAPSELPNAMAEVGADLRALRERLRRHDLDCRSLHLAVAEQLGQGWPAYLQGLARALHYASHSEANLRDLQGLMHHTLHLVTATRNVNKAGRRRAMDAADELYNALYRVNRDADQIQLDPSLAEALGAASWREVLGEFKLPGPNDANLGDWLQAVDGWVDQFAGACAALRSESLSLLLVTEERLVRQWQADEDPGSAPQASSVTASADVLTEGGERSRDSKQSLWVRFQTADGWLPASARLLVAGGIVASVLGWAGQVSQAKLTVYNGLARTVTVSLDGQTPITLASGQHRQAELTAQHTAHIEARTLSGELIEAFDAPVGGAYERHVYNVANGASLVEWTASYGPTSPRPDKPLGTPRWLSTTAQHVMEQPPEQMSTKRGQGATRLVLTAVPPSTFMGQMSALPAGDEGQMLIRAHARWDDALAERTLVWWNFFARQADATEVLQQRLRTEPLETAWLRIEQDLAQDSGKDAACQRQRGLASRDPTNPDLQYLMTRCMPEGAAKSDAFLAGFAQHPDNAWWAYAAGGVMGEQAKWAKAVAAWQLALKARPGFAEMINPDLARLQRLLLAQEPGALQRELDVLAKRSEFLNVALAGENAPTDAHPRLRAATALGAGQLDEALKLVVGSDATTQHRMLRLAAASDGAKPALVQQALALPLTEGLDRHTIWAALGLAIREQQDPQPLLRHLAQRDDMGHVPVLPRLTPFLAALRAGQPASVCEAHLDGLSVEQRGQALALAVVIQGRKAPGAWRTAARQLLFTSERPYFTES